MTKVHHLESKLKALKLGGMLDTLELRLDQARKDRLGYVEFLELLLEDEVQRRANRSLAARIAKARFEEAKTLEEFNFSFNPKIPAQQIRDLATCRFVERKESVLICGPVGVGKSHIAQALGHQACRLGYKVFFTKTLRLLADLGGGRADGSWEVRLRRYLQLDLLILDDFCLTPLNPQQAEDIYQLIEERYRRGSMVVTSNRSPQDWYDLFPNPVLAESALDRLINCAHQVVLTGRSYRPMLRPDRRKAVAEEVGVV
jgi:DNA replication protein DnaC